jgi:hypothetical protein
MTRNIAQQEHTLLGIVMHGISPGNNNFKTNFESGNYLCNFNQELPENCTDEHITNDNYGMSKLPAELNGQGESRKAISQENSVHVSKEKEARMQELDIAMITPVKRSKRREDSVDEDSSTRAERLKAKKNLDAPGMSNAKSFLSFSDTRIESSISSFGISRQ